MAKKPPFREVAVLVLNFNGQHFLEVCFQSLLKNAPHAFDIYLIDNHSTDDSVDFTRTRFPGIKIIQNETNLGFAGAYDRIIRGLDHQYVVLLNNDTAVETGWLEALYGVAEDNPRVAACGSKIMMMRRPHLIDHAGGLLTFIGSGLDLGKWTTDAGQYQEVKEVGFGSGCSLLLRRSAYLEVGGFDRDYFMYHEDVDLCWRLRLAGYSVKYVPDSVVYHHLGGTATRGRESPFQLYWCQKNRLANMVKNLGPGSLPAGLGISLGYDAFRVLRFLAQGNLELVRLVIRGYVDTFRRRRVLLHQRRSVQKLRVVSDAELRVFFSPWIAAARDYLRLLRVKSG